MVTKVKHKPTVEDIKIIEAKPVLTVAEAALLAGVSVGCLYRRWREGSGPVSFKIGKARRIRRRDLDAWMTSLSKR